MFRLKFTPPYSLNTQRGWHTSELYKVIQILHKMWIFNIFRTSSLKNYCSEQSVFLCALCCIYQIKEREVWNSGV